MLVNFHLLLFFANAKSYYKVIKVNGLNPGVSVVCVV